MNEIEIRFLEEYKNLEILLNDIFNVQHGVSAYIEKLEENKNLGTRIVPYWMNDYYDLKHVRYIRNKITHDNDESGCEAKDIYFVQDFYERVIDNKDSLSVLRMHQRKQEEEMYARQRVQQKLKREEPKEQIDQFEDMYKNDREITWDGFKTLLLILLFISIAVAIVLFLIYKSRI